MTNQKSAAAPERKKRWKQDPEAVQASILEAAATEFAEHGLTGARVDDIADRSRFTKRMIYYYFNDKETLYLRVLEEAYRKVRGEEAALDLSSLNAKQALRKLVEFTFDHHRKNEPFIRLVMIENINNGRHLETSTLIAKVNESAVDRINEICALGKEDGTIRADLSPLELHWMISAMSFFNVSNQPSFARVFGGTLFLPDGQERLRDMVVEAVLAIAEPKL
ncbi:MULTISPECIES: TetR/AcrR family transcriptional regulator [Cohaesibacter]|uniref:TetR/AcrR family transcriptional regulator n=1 Tax=Cohaesibacter TaxID=655352 RepID=UPI000DEB5A69|nr:MULTISPECIES: TetR/AcrR family transcriptional regulator [Cohaesibacter]TLP48393.1 TetR/AcrR family transcriptional regulator [Cohaesibacter sp. CAU 1516]